tara:strand:+ start:340 stop:804 length:465 start_codon:yes stop_codon:yes gene_type:complete
MANVNIYAKFDYTDADGNVYSDGSLTTAKTISITNGEIFDRTYRIESTTLTEILSDSTLSSFDFLWIESDQLAEIQLVCSQGNSAPNLVNAWVVKLNAGLPFVLHNDDSRNQGNTGALASWESTWTADTIDAIEFYHQTGTPATVRVFAVKSAS